MGIEEQSRNYNIQKTTGDGFLVNVKEGWEVVIM